MMTAEEQELKNRKSDLNTKIKEIRCTSRRVYSQIKCLKVQFEELTLDELKNVKTVSLQLKELNYARKVLVCSESIMIVVKKTLEFDEELDEKLESARSRCYNEWRKALTVYNSEMGKTFDITIY